MPVSTYNVHAPLSEEGRWRASIINKRLCDFAGGHTSAQNQCSYPETGSMLRNNEEGSYGLDESRKTR